MKSYFIGLGGAGMRTVAEIKKRIMTNDADYEHDYAFTVIDSEKQTFNGVNQNGVVFHPSEFILLHSPHPRLVYQQGKNAEYPTADQKRFLEWVIPQQPCHMDMVLLNEPFSAQRQVGRIGLYYCYYVVRDELEKKIGRFLNQQPDDDGRRNVDVWVITSSCGGTGSSMILDVLYMINSISQQITNGEPNVKLVLFMPQTYVDLTPTSINLILNGYACLSEINFFRSNYERGDRQTFENYAVKPSPLGMPIMDFPLFKYVIPICLKNNWHSKLNTGQLYPTTAEMIYYLSIGSGKGLVNSLISNLVAYSLQAGQKDGQTRSLVGYGYRAIKKPNKEFKEYLKRRALYEIVRYGLLDDTKPANFNSLIVDFANEAVLSKLFSLSDNIDEDGKSYEYSIVNVATDSIQALVTSFVNTTSRYDENQINRDALRAILTRLQNLQETDKLEQIKQEVFYSIIQEIDRLLNVFILDYGFRHAYTLLDRVDVFYLEPLLRYVKNVLEPSAANTIRSTKSICDKFLNDGFILFRRVAVNQSINNYKEAIIQELVYSLSIEIIEKLTNAPHGYLKLLRKGNGNDFVGIKEIVTLLRQDSKYYEDNFAQLAKDFRATSIDAMTIYVPSLSEIATGENNTDWKANNIFDLLYRESILEQQEITIGLESKCVPVRKSQNGCGLKNIIEQIDIERNLFVSLIKSKALDIYNNKELRIIRPIHDIVDQKTSAVDTTAGEWFGKTISDVINDRFLIPSQFANPKDFLVDMRDTRSIPLFYPLMDGADVQDESFLFVGHDKSLAMELGYCDYERGHFFVSDSKMDDCFLIMRMCIGLQFEMYKYFSYYKDVFTHYIDDVRNQRYGCFIDQRFNENGLPMQNDESV